MAQKAAVQCEQGGNFVMDPKFIRWKVDLIYQNPSRILICIVLNIIVFFNLFHELINSYVNSAFGFLVIIIINNRLREKALYKFLVITDY